MKTVINSILSLLLFAVAATATVGDANESDAKQFSQPVKVFTRNGQSGGTGIAPEIAQAG